MNLLTPAEKERERERGKRVIESAVPKNSRIQWNLQTRDTMGPTICPHYLGGQIIH